MKKLLARVTLVAILNLAIFELCEQISVHWKESQQEGMLLPQWIFMFATLLWALWPSFKHKPTGPVGVVAAAVPLWIALYAIIAIYSWHVRPNLGLYQESDWVADHPGFQRELRARIQGNLWTWHRPPRPTTAPSTPSPSQ